MEDVEDLRPSKKKVIYSEVYYILFMTFLNKSCKCFSLVTFSITTINTIPFHFDVAQAHVRNYFGSASWSLSSRKASCEPL